MKPVRWLSISLHGLDKLMIPKYFLTAAIVLSSPCTNNTNANQMPHDASQEAIKIIYRDSFFAQPANKHRRDELIKEIADLYRYLDDMSSQYESGDGYNYIGLSDDDVEELEKERFHSYKRLEK